MKVVILAGGYGTRIRDVAEDIPKPMIPVGNHPILWHIMKYYAHFGHTRFILCLGYKGSVIKDFFLNYEAHIADFTLTIGKGNPVVYHGGHSEEGWKITFAETGLNAMTGARIKKIKQYIGEDEEFLLTYGDGVGDINLKGLLEFHRNHKRILTVTGVRPPSRFGELVCDTSGQVIEFNEKPQAMGGLISGGFFVCNRALFNYLNNDENLVFEKEPLERLVRDNQMMVYEHKGFWQCMDTHRDYMLLNSMHNKGEASWEIWK